MFTTSPIAAKGRLEDLDPLLVDARHVADTASIRGRSLGQTIDITEPLGDVCRFQKELAMRALTEQSFDLPEREEHIAPQRIVVQLIQQLGRDDDQIPRLLDSEVIECLERGREPVPNRA